MTEISWSIIITRAGTLLATVAMSTIDLSFPVHMVERLHDKYGACTMQVFDSTGQVWKKSWE